MTTAIPEEALFFIADREYSLVDLLRTLYRNPTVETQSHFISTNSHLSKNRVTVGQMVILTPPNTAACQRWEGVMQEAARKVDAELALLDISERKTLAKHYAFLNDVTTATAPMYGWANSYFHQKNKQVEHVLKQIERLYVSTYNRSGAVRGDSLFAQRKVYFTQLDRALNGMMAREMFGRNLPSNRLKSQLGLSSKALVHQWKQQSGAHSIVQFVEHKKNLDRTAKVFSRLGYASIALDVAGGAANIHKACTLGQKEEPCTKSKITEPLRVAGSVGGGSLAGFGAAYGVCNLLFGLQTGGTSLLWCGILVGAAGGYGGSKLGGALLGSIGEYTYRTSR